MSKWFDGGKIFTICALVVLAGLSTFVLSACGGESPWTPMTPSTQLTIGSIADGGLPLSVDELLLEADYVLLVTPTRQLDEHWFASDLLVATDFEARVDQIVAGNAKAMDVIILRTPGGRVRAEFPAYGGRKPATGDQVQLEEYIDSPFYQIGRQELVIVHEIATHGDAPVYSAIGPAGRHLMVDGTLTNLYPVDVDLNDPPGVRTELLGMTLSDLDRRFEAVRVNPPTPTAVPPTRVRTTPAAD